MVWFAVLGLFSCILIFTGYRIAVGRIRRYRKEAELRRSRAFTEMMEIAERQEAERPSNWHPSTRLRAGGTGRAPLSSARGRQDAE